MATLTHQDAQRRGSHFCSLELSKIGCQCNNFFLKLSLEENLAYAFDEMEDVEADNESAIKVVYLCWCVMRYVCIYVNDQILSPFLSRKSKRMMAQKKKYEMKTKMCVAKSRKKLSLKGITAFLVSVSG